METVSVQEIRGRLLSILGELDITVMSLTCKIGRSLCPSEYKDLFPTGYVNLENCEMASLSER